MPCSAPSPLPAPPAGSCLPGPGLSNARCGWGSGVAGSRSKKDEKAGESLTKKEIVAITGTPEPSCGEAPGITIGR
ncbi:hypothetical protein GCM10010266_62930 [Streptomyces griseomycini]|nr:hypothetical protein GCM10010266_62930 [Streptomyces griseomycini]